MCYLDLPENLIHNGICVSRPGHQQVVNIATDGVHAQPLQLATHGCRKSFQQNILDGIHLTMRNCKSCSSRIRRRLGRTSSRRTRSASAAPTWSSTQPTPCRSPARRATAAPLTSYCRNCHCHTMQIPDAERAMAAPPLACRGRLLLLCAILQKTDEMIHSRAMSFCQLCNAHLLPGVSGVDPGPQRLADGQARQGRPRARLPARPQPRRAAAVPRRAAPRPAG